GYPDRNGVRLADFHHGPDPAAGLPGQSNPDHYIHAAQQCDVGAFRSSSRGGRNGSVRRHCC
ncbi:hypothetical protein ACQ7B2_10245, partial [Escherichia coli]